MAVGSGVVATTLPDPKSAVSLNFEFPSKTVVETSVGNAPGDPTLGVERVMPTGPVTPSSPESVVVVMLRVPEMVAIPSLIRLVHVTLPTKLPVGPVYEKVDVAPFIETARFKPGPSVALA